MATAWRAQDEALLTRLEDRAVLESVWARWAGTTAALPHPRAAGVLPELRRHPSGAEAIDRAREGELGPLMQLLSAPPKEVLTGALAHHLALLHEQLARERETREDASARRTATDAWLTSQAMWLYLGEQRAYLNRVGEAVVGEALPVAQVRRELDEASRTTLHRLSRRAEAGARELTEPARLALRALRRMDQAAAMAELPEEPTRRLLVQARQARERAIDVATARVEAALDEAIVADAGAPEIAPMLRDGAAVWTWSERDRIVVHMLIERITPYLWEQYRHKRWDAIRAMLAPLEEMVDHLAHAIANDPRQLAYAGPCAQMLVFRAEVSRTLSTQMALSERAVALCPTHRNGRLYLADCLVERATNTMDRSVFLERKKLDQVHADLQRAESLYPQLKRLPKAKERFAKASRGRSYDE
ncbi:MAG: hypothetical protein AB8I08_23940 [Sandaracinaceae bacterium]